MVYDTLCAANSAGGFFSLFPHLVEEKKNKQIFLIKGGPGTGKSTFMKKIADAAAQRGHIVEKIHCSSDIHSLDGVRIVDKRVLFLDATSPHCVDPHYPGAVEEILPLGEYWDSEKIKAHRKEIITLSTDISDCFKTVYAYMNAIGSIERRCYHFLNGICDHEKIRAAIQKFLRQNAVLPSATPNRKQSKRFCSAVTGEGFSFFFSPFEEMCDQIVVLEDTSLLAEAMIGKLAAYFKSAGYETILFLNPTLPTEKCDHLIVPQLRLGFVSDNSYHKVPQSDKIIRKWNTRSYLDHAELSHVKNKLQFAKKVCNELYEEIQKTLVKEKDLHDKLESYYIPAMDFNAADERCKSLLLSLGL